MAVTLTLAKEHLRVRHTDEDTLIGQYMAAAALLVEKMSGTLLTRREVSQEFANLSGALPVYWGPEPETLVVSYTDTDDAPQTIADARLVRGNLYAPAAGWPSIADNSVVTLTYTAGWTDVPADLMSAQLLLIGHWYAQREAVNVGNIVAELPLAVDALIQPYRKVLV